MTVTDTGTTAGRAGATAGGALRITGVRKSYGGSRGVQDVSLDVAPGEFLTMLGPSGSGKTTTLNLVAGFLDPDAGSVELDGEELAGVPPHRRGLGMVFQQYALFPHMSVADNVGYPLAVRRVGRRERRERVREALELVRLAEVADRRPAQLSGGQQQRVALARAIVFRPRLLLMDEPLGALDKKLRAHLQVEISRICRELGATVVYVTHDQEEALALSDRIAIYNEGRIEQLGTAEELYTRPRSVFVADFMGESTIVRGTRRGDRLVHDDGELTAGPVVTEVADGAAAAVGGRPERVRLHPADSLPDALPTASLTGTVRERVYLGSDRKYLVATPSGLVVTARAGTGDAVLEIGDDVVASWEPDASVLVPAP